MNVIVSNKNEGLLNSLDIDIIKSINGEFTSDEIIRTFSNFFFNRMFLDITAIKDYMNIANIQKLSMGLPTDKVIFLLDGGLMNNSGYLSKLISIGIYNFGDTKESLMYLYNHPNSYKDVAHIHELNNNTTPDASPQEKKNKLFGTTSDSNTINQARNAKVIGFKNATSGAGATTLIYMLKKYLAQKGYTIALELNKNDFGFFNEKEMYSVNEENFAAAINKFSNANYILVDINNANTELCDEIIYLLEPSIIKLNKMMLVNSDIFDKMFGKKIVLNKSLLTEENVLEFENESKSKVAYNIPPLNERENNEKILSDFVNILGIK